MFNTLDAGLRRHDESTSVSLIIPNDRLQQMRYLGNAVTWSDTHMANSLVSVGDDADGSGRRRRFRRRASSASMNDFQVIKLDELRRLDLSQLVFKGFGVDSAGDT
jgi:hypothetical protein